MGMVSLGEIADTGALLKQKYSRVSPHFIPKILINMAAGHISLKHNLKVRFDLALCNGLFFPLVCVCAVRVTVLLKVKHVHIGADIRGTR